jgi:2-haloacid dehalogenase
MTFLGEDALEGEDLSIHNGGATVQPVIAFDVNETLLDLSALDPLFERVFGDRSVRPLWFAQMLQLSFVGIITNDYVDFTTAQRAALRIVAERRDIELRDQDAEEIVGAMRMLPAHPEVRDALLKLRESGVRMCSLTNSPWDVVAAQLVFADIRDCFDEVISADEVKRLKPAPEPYRHAAERMSTDVSNVRLVAAHAWDVSGALAVGCTAAFVGRPGMIASPLGPAADIVGADLTAVVDQIIEKDAASNR